LGEGGNSLKKIVFTSPAKSSWSSTGLCWNERRNTEKKKGKGLGGEGQSVCITLWSADRGTEGSDNVRKKTRGGKKTVWKKGRSSIYYPYQLRIRSVKKKTDIATLGRLREEEGIIVGQEKKREKLSLCGGVIRITEGCGGYVAILPGGKMWSPKKEGKNDQKKTCKGERAVDSFIVEKMKGFECP